MGGWLEQRPSAKGWVSEEQDSIHLFGVCSAARVVSCTGWGLKDGIAHDGKDVYTCRCSLRSSMISWSIARKELTSASIVTKLVFARSEWPAISSNASITGFASGFAKERALFDMVVRALAAALIISSIVPLTIDSVSWTRSSIF